MRPEDVKQNDELLLEEFSYSLAELVDRTCGDESVALFGAKYDGVLILIDEADRSSAQLRLGSFFKLLAERLQRRSCNRVVFGLAGISELRNTLFEDHPSSLRIFDELVLNRLSEPEVDRVIDLCLAEAERLNGKPTTITPGGRQALRIFSEGYPHFIQQFGFSAFDADKDDEITQEDVMAGGFGQHGAMEAIGDRYYRDAFYRRIQKESYRQVLRIMADKLDLWVTKKEIRSRFKGNESTLDNAILALRKRSIILSKEGEQGVYRLQHKGFALWIKLFTTDPGQLAQSVVSSSTAAVESTTPVKSTPAGG